MTIWNTLDVPLERGWQCTLIPAPQYARLMSWGYNDLTARSLYRRAGRERWPLPSNSLQPDETGRRRKWEADVKRQLADDRLAFARHFRPLWDFRSITGGQALQEVQTFVRDALGVAHWNQPNDNAGIQRMLCEAVANKRLIPVVNREYRGRPRVARPDPAPLRWPDTGGGAATPAPEIISYIDFVALQRANGELGERAPESRTAVRPVPDSGAAVGAPSLSASLGDARPFEYRPEAIGDDLAEIAARGPGNAEEAECEAMYEARMTYCRALSKMYGGDARTWLACKEQAFRDYQACRGYL
jgi:hypothetical protein